MLSNKYIFFLTNTFLLLIFPKAQKELLDTELDLHKRLSSGEDTTELRKKLSQLQVEVRFKRSYPLHLTPQIILFSSSVFQASVWQCILYSTFCCYSGCTIRYFTCGSRKDHVLSRSRKRQRPWRKRKGLTESHGCGPPPQSTISWGIHWGGERWITSAFLSKFLK